MVKKKAVQSKKRNSSNKPDNSNVDKNINNQKKPFDKKKISTIELKSEHDIAMDFAIRTYKKFDKVIKSVVLFGSVAKQETVAGSDIDIVIILDDVSIKWDQELIAWYREELDRLIRTNPYNRSLHINTVKLSTWWEDLIRGDPVVINMIRYGEAMLDTGGFFNPLKYLLLEGKIKPSPEAIYVSLQRAPIHLARSKTAILNSIEGLYWAMVDSAHAALIAINVLPPSPEHLAVDLRDNFVSKGKLKIKYVQWYRDLLNLHKQVSHGKIRDIKGADIDVWQDRSREFVEVMTKLVQEIVGV